MALPQRVLNIKSCWNVCEPKSIGTHLPRGVLIPNMGCGVPKVDSLLASPQVLSLRRLRCISAATLLKRTGFPKGWQVRNNSRVLPERVIIADVNFWIHAFCKAFEIRPEVFLSRAWVMEIQAQKVLVPDPLEFWCQMVQSAINSPAFNIEIEYFYDSNVADFSDYFLCDHRIQRVRALIEFLRG